jgi:phage gp29-like protein
LLSISGVEFIAGADFDCAEIPRKHIRPENGTIVKSQYQNEGIPIDTLPFVFTVGNKRDPGKLLTCSMYSLYKLGGFADFAQYVEIFGQPVRIIYYDAYDTKTKEQLRQILSQSGSSLAMMIPQQAKFEMLDGKTANANGDLQIKFLKACNDEMSIAVLGNTETTASSSSSGYAQAKIMAEGQKEILESDIKFVQNVLNSPKFITILASYGFPVKDGGKFLFEQETNLDELQKTVEIAQKIAMNVPVDDDYWYSLGIVPKPDSYEELKKQQAPSNSPERGEHKPPVGAGLLSYFIIISIRVN